MVYQPSLMKKFFVYFIYLLCPTLYEQYATQGQFFFKGSRAGLNSEFSFFWTIRLTKAKEPSLTHSWREQMDFMSFLRVLLQSEMQTAFSEI